MKRRIILAAVALALLSIGFAVGGFIQHHKSGYHYQVRATKDYDSPVGSIRWSYVTESVGASFIDCGTTILEFDGRTIYKANRDFQESSPYASNIRATEDGLSWEDGDYRFDLSIRRLQRQ